jgi:hypothetical protein
MTLQIRQENQRRKDCPPIPHPLGRSNQTKYVIILVTSQSQSTPTEISLKAALENIVNDETLTDVTLEGTDGVRVLVVIKVFWLQIAACFVVCFLVDLWKPVRK